MTMIRETRPKTTWVVEVLDFVEVVVSKDTKQKLTSGGEGD